MRRAFYPLLIVPLLLAVGGGVRLGESTIAMINPVHFQGPALHPRDRGAALIPVDAAPWEAAEARPAFTTLYGWEEGNSARFEDCGGCEAISARDAFSASVQPVMVHETDDAWQALPEDEHVDADDGQTIPVVNVRDQVLRYAYYEIESSDEAVVQVWVE